MDFLEFSDVAAELMGAMAPGRLKLTDQHIIFKYTKTGKVEQFSGSDVEVVNWQRLGGGWGIRIFLTNGTLHRFGGFKEADQERISKFFTQSYKKDMLEKELCLKGWNWGTAHFNSGTLSFEVGNTTSFEIPLNNVSQCNTGKNEVTMEFHQNDDAPVGLMELRFHIPSSELAGDKDPVEAFQEQVMSKASVITATGDAIAIFREVQCLTPRGRYDIRVYPTFLHLHGKTFDFKVPISSVLRLFLLPHKDGRQMFFVVSMDPPIKQGMTRYHFLITLFNQEEETELDLPFTDEELKSKFDGRMPKEISGSTYEVLSKVMKALVDRKITVPGKFTGHSGTPAISCSYKAAAGYLYPLERGFMYIHKPPLHIRFDELSCVHFARSGGSTRSFDFEVETRAGIVHTFSSIEKEEYPKLFDFASGHKLRVKNTGKMDGGRAYKDEFKGSGSEDESDPYLARVKAEARERSSGEDESSEDEDFNPGEEASDVAEEFDSNASSSSSADEEGSGKSGEDDSDTEKRKKKPKEKKVKKAKTVSEKPRKPRKPKKEKDENKPKRPQSAYFLWLNENRANIKEKYPGISITELSKKAGEMWREVKDRSEWDQKAAEAKREYEVKMKEYKASGGGTVAASSGKPKKKTATPTKTKPSSSSPSKAGAFKSKEYISDDSSTDSSADDDKPLKKAAEKKPAAAKQSKAEAENEDKSDADESEEEAASTPASSAESSEADEPSD